MPGTQLQLTPLQIRKQLLLQESEINRAQLQIECGALKEHLHDLSAQCDSALAHASLLVSGLGSLRSLWSESQPKEDSWLARLSALFRTGFTLWQTFKTNRDA